MLGSVHEYPILIKEQHLDSFGHVNNAVYLQLFEEARWDLITRNGFGHAQVHEKKMGPTILEVTLVFKHELRNRQQVCIRSWLESHERKVGRMVQQIVDDNGAVYCEARFTFGLFDLTARRLIEPTPEWWRAIGVASPPDATS